MIVYKFLTFGFMNLRLAVIIISFLFFGVKNILGQEGPQQTKLKVEQLVEKKAEYHRMTGGEQEGYRIKIHFGVDKDHSKTVKDKFAAKFNEFATDLEYQQPNWVVLVGDFKTKLDAYQSLKKIQSEFPNAFIVKGKIKVR